MNTWDIYCQACGVLVALAGLALMIVVVIWLLGYGLTEVIKARKAMGLYMYFARKGTQEKFQRFCEAEGEARSR